MVKRKRALFRTASSEFNEKPKLTFAMFSRKFTTGFSETGFVTDTPWETFFSSRYTSYFYLVSINRRSIKI